MGDRTIARASGVLVAVFVAALAGCDARSLTPDGGTGAGGSSGGAGTTGTGGTAGAPATCPATCETAAGAVFAFSSVGQIYGALVGLWRICGGPGTVYPGAPTDTIGVEYGPASAEPTASGSTVGGNMYYLVQGTNGPERGPGFDYQLTYDVSPQGNGTFQLNMHPMPNSGFGGGFRYSPCPEQFEIQGGSVSPGAKAILVRF